jgi:hypothetical protein
VDLKERAQNLLNQLLSAVAEIKPLNDLSDVTINQCSEILQLASAKVVLLIQSTCADLASPEKKELAMTIISDFYDQVFMVVEIPFIPKILQPIFQKLIKQILLLVVDGAINGLVTTFRNTGIICK